MRLLDRLVRRDAGYWEGMSSGSAVLTSSYGSPDREAILPQMSAWAQQAHASASPVFSAILVRMMLLAEAQFQFQAKDDRHLYGNTSLGILEHPWGPGSTSGDLIARMEQDASIAGNSYTWSAPGTDPLVRLRPDWVTIVSELVQVPGGGSYRRKVGYWWEPPKSVLSQGTGFLVPADEVAHWAPIPDPQASFRGMSWLTPVTRDILGDDGMAQFKIRYMQANATPNLVIKYAQKLQPGTVDSIRERLNARYGGPNNAGKTLILDQGADLVAVGNSMAQIDFTNVSQVGTERILAAAGVPPLLIGLESIKGAGKSYEEVIRRFADLTLRPLWRSLCSALEPIIPGLPSGSRLWVDTADIAALQDGQQVRAQVALVRAQALLTLTQAGYTRDSAVTAVDSGDITLLVEDPDAQQSPAAPTQVQHLLPQAQPGATADPLPPTLPRLQVGSTSPGDGGNNTRPTPRPAAARRGEANGHA